MHPSQARLFAIKAHGDQKYGNQPYVHHLDQVVLVLMEFGIFDDDMLCAAYLHDCLEDTPTLPSEIEVEFGPHVTLLVSLVTSQPGKNRAERWEKTYPGLKLNPQAITLKLADRIANVRASAYDPIKWWMYHDEYPIFKQTLKLMHHTALWGTLDSLFDAADAEVALIRAEATARLSEAAPKEATQAHVIYDMTGDAPNEHPQVVMQRLGEELGFTIIDSVPQSIADCWWFWIKYSEKPKLPSYVRQVKWRPIGSV